MCKSRIVRHVFVSICEIMQAGFVIYNTSIGKHWRDDFKVFVKFVVLAVTLGKISCFRKRVAALIEGRNL